MVGAHLHYKVCCSHLVDGYWCTPGVLHFFKLVCMVHQVVCYQGFISGTNGMWTTSLFVPFLIMPSNMVLLLPCPSSTWIMLLAQHLTVKFTTSFAIFSFLFSLLHMSQTVIHSWQALSKPRSAASKFNVGSSRAISYHPWSFCLSLPQSLSYVAASQSVDSAWSSLFQTQVASPL